MLTDMQKAFVEAYVHCGNAADAARAAGYSEATAKQQGYALLQKEHIQEAINAALKSHMAQTGPAAIKRLQELMKSDNEQVAIKAAMDLADRAGLKPKQQTELSITDDRSDEEIEASVLSMLSELQIHGRH